MRSRGFGVSVSFLVYVFSMRRGRVCCGFLGVVVKGIVGY